MKVFTYIMMVGALCCLFCYSKEKEDAPTGATFNKTFVTGYLTPESIVISKMNSGIKITFKGDLITSGRSFDALSIYYNDLSYNRYTIDGPRTAINDSIWHSVHSPIPVKGIPEPPLEIAWIARFFFTVSG